MSAFLIRDNIVTSFDIRLFGSIRSAAYSGFRAFLSGLHFKALSKKIVTNYYPVPEIVIARIILPAANRIHVGKGI
jgi:hypothetical protein